QRVHKLSWVLCRAGARSGDRATTSKDCRQSRFGAASSLIVGKKHPKREVMKYQVIALVGVIASACVARGQDILDANKMKMLEGHKHAADALAFSSDSKRLFSGSLFYIKVWDVAAGKELRSIKGHSQYVKALAVSRDGKRLISGSWDAAVKMGERCVKIC